jgi:drug/metabolite transporter (DMT)-like permease
MPPRTALAVLAAAGFAISIWGAVPAVTKIAVQYFDPIVVGLLRTVLAGAITVPLALILRQPVPATWPGRGLLACSGFGGLVGFPILFTVGMRLTSASHGALLLASLPVFGGFIVAVVDRRWPRSSWWIGSAVAVIGEAVLIFSASDDQGSEASLLGDLLILGACVFAALGYVAGGRLTQSGYAAWAVAFWGAGWAALALAPVLPVVWDGHAAATAGWTGWASVLYLAVGATIVAYVCWIWALARGGIARVALAQFVQPVVGVALAVGWLGETLTWPLIGATALILIGVYVAQRP